MNERAPQRRTTFAMLLGVSVGVLCAVFAMRWWAEASALPAPAPLPQPQPQPQQAVAESETVAVDAGAALPARGKGRGVRPTEPRLPGEPRLPLAELTTTLDWPVEPESPTSVDEARFIEAFVLLCGPHADDAVRSWYGRWLLRSAREYEADPFLLGALAFRASGCSESGGRLGYGLTGIDPMLYERDLRKGRYRFNAFVDGVWSARSLKLGRFAFSPQFVASAEANLYFAAAFLRAWSEQSSGLRAAFVQPSEYRHYVSHFIWGDQVQGHRDEDAILVERRRLLEYYGALRPRPPVRWRGFELGCPLDGCPRVVTSTLGDARDNGARLHAGNDFESTRGEPVRAVADGIVVFAGVDLPGRGAAAKIPIWAQRNVDPAAMGAGGLYVCIDHGTSAVGEQLVTCSMHLEAATVVQGRQLKRGEQVGRVGTSGIKESKPHLHFELHSSRGVHRATDLLKGIALGTPATHAAAAEARPNHEFAQ